MQYEIDPTCVNRNCLWQKVTNPYDQWCCKRGSFIYHTKNCQKECKMRPSSSIFRALTWRRRTPTAAAEKTMSAAGVGEVAAAKRFVAGIVEGQRWRQGLCESGRKDNDCGEACIYRDRDATVLLHRCPWRFTSKGHMAVMQHIGGCSTFPRTPRLSGGRSRFSGFQVKRIDHLKQI